MVPKIKGLNYEEQLRRLKQLPLPYRRAQGDKIGTFKILTGKRDDICSNGILKCREIGATRGNSLDLFKARSRLNVRKYAFSCKVVHLEPFA